MYYRCAFVDTASQCERRSEKKRRIKMKKKKHVKDLSSVLMELADIKANPDKERAKGRRKAAQQVSGGKLR